MIYFEYNKIKHKWKEKRWRKKGGMGNEGNRRKTESGGGYFLRISINEEKKIAEM